ncbi:MAG: energy-coupling factor ABC transporter permease [Elusimicrobiota bacterium]|nr:energy-coupling factor ABC transporter permease [Elusimicrobiota bacterium]
MHIPDGFLNNKAALGMLAGALGMLAFCLSKVFRALAVMAGSLAGNNGNTGFGGVLGLSGGAGKYFRKMAVIAIWVFACQMFNIPIQSATSAHLIGGVFAAVLVGPFAGFVVISSVLIVQSLFFADGGILALGANIINMAFVGSFLSYFIYKFFEKKNYYLAIAAACFFSVLGAALFCLIELSLSATVSFTNAFGEMMKLHFFFAAFETLITIGLLKLFKSWEI